MSTNSTYPTISDAEFQSLIVSNTAPSVVVFTAEWLGEGAILDGIMERLSAAYAERAGFFRMDVERSPDTPNLLGVNRVPGVFFFKGGEIVDHFSGIQSRKNIESRLLQLLN